MLFTKKEKIKRSELELSANEMKCKAVASF